MEPGSGSQLHLASSFLVMHTLEHARDDITSVQPAYYYGTKGKISGHSRNRDFKKNYVIQITPAKHHLITR